MSQFAALLMHTERRCQTEPPPSFRYNNGGAFVRCSPNGNKVACGEQTKQGYRFQNAAARCW